MSKSLHILIVEDSQDDAESLVKELEQNGYPTVYQRVNNQVGMETALNSEIAWDIVLAEYYLNQFDAVAALQLLKEYQIDFDQEPKPWSSACFKHPNNSGKT